MYLAHLIIAIALENLVFAYIHFHIQITGGCTARPSLTFALKTNTIAIINTGRNFYL